jgi:hypothetical protein
MRTGDGRRYPAVVTGIVFIISACGIFAVVFYALGI